MILESGPFQVEHVRKRSAFVFPVEGERDWCVRYTKLREHPTPPKHGKDVVVQLGSGHDNKELEVSEITVMSYYTLNLRSFGI